MTNTDYSNDNSEGNVDRTINNAHWEVASKKEKIINH